jgi:hypothetical protein
MSQFRQYGAPEAKPQFQEFPQFGSSGAPGPSQPYSDGTYVNTQNPYEAYFGRSPKPIYAQPYERELLNLPDAYDGHNPHLSNVMITRITNEDTFWVRTVLPWEKKEDADNITWSVLTFNDHMLNRRPEQSVSRLLSFERTEESANFVCMGIAMFLESGFYKTKEGQMFYNFHLLQIQNATVETACLGAALALLNAKPPRHSIDLHPSRTLSEQEFRRQLDASVAMFGIVQSTENGLQIAQDTLKSVLTSRGVIPDCAILPEGALKYSNAVKLENTAYLYNGTAGGKQSVKMDGSMSLYESRKFRKGEHQEPDDPFFQIRTVGSYFHMLYDDTRNIVDGWNPDFRSIRAWSEDLNDFHTHTLRSVADHCGLWNPADYSFTRLGALVMGEDNISWRDWLQKNGVLERFTKLLSSNETTCSKFGSWVLGLNKSTASEGPLSVTSATTTAAAAPASSTSDAVMLQMMQTMAQSVSLATGNANMIFKEQEIRRVETQKAELEKTTIVPSDAAATKVRDAQLKELTNRLAALTAELETTRKGAADVAAALQQSNAEMARMSSTKPTKQDPPGSSPFARQDKTRGQGKRRDTGRPGASYGRTATLASNQARLSPVDEDGASTLFPFGEQGPFPTLGADGIPPWVSPSSTAVNIAQQDDPFIMNNLLTTGLPRQPSSSAPLASATGRTNMFSAAVREATAAAASGGSGNKTASTASLAPGGDTEPAVDPAELRRQQMDQLRKQAAKDREDGDEPQTGASSDAKSAGQWRSLGVYQHESPDDPANDYRPHEVSLEQQRLIDAAIDSNEFDENWLYRTAHYENNQGIHGYLGKRIAIRRALIRCAELGVSEANKPGLKLLLQYSSAFGARVDTTGLNTLNGVIAQLTSQNLSDRDGAVDSCIKSRRFNAPVIGAFTTTKAAVSMDYWRDHITRNATESDDWMVLIARFMITPNTVVDPKLVEIVLSRLYVVDAKFFKFLLEAQLDLPLSFLLFAPHQRFRCGSMIACKSGPSLGNTYFGNSDFQLARNAGQKTIFGHYTIKLKSVVTNPRNIAIARDVYVHGYEGGAGHEYWKHNDDDGYVDMSDVERYRQGHLSGRDLFVVAVPPSYRPKSYYMDITGRFDSDVYGGEQRQSDHYPTSNHYARYWQWRHGKDTMSQEYEPTDMPRYNTIVLQGAQINFQHTGNGNGNWNRRIINKGHLSQRVYPGCASVRMGRAMYLQPIDYNSTATIAVIA